jgi:tRNA G18 (ribose-2'-O)-methylase SpoU
MPFVDIDDVNDTRLDPYRGLNIQNLTRSAGRLIAESRLLVQRLLVSTLKTESILSDRRFASELQPVAATDVPVFLMPTARLRQVVGFHFHRGMLACARRPDNPPLTDLLSQAAGILVVCAQVVDPTNLAGVIRNAAAFGAQGVLLGPHCADPFSRRVVRVSMGAAFVLPIRIATNLQSELRELALLHAYRRVATVLDPQAAPIWAANKPARLALVFGSEGHGLDAEIIAECDEQVTLPMQLSTDSLNLATASGIFLYEYSVRRR